MQVYSYIATAKSRSKTVIQLRAGARCKISYSFAREAICSVKSRFPPLACRPKMNHFGTLDTTKHTLFHPTASGHPICTPGRPKRSIVSTCAPKTLPKWSPKRCQKWSKKGACSRTRKTKFLLLFTTLAPCRPPLKRLLFGGLWAPFSLLFQRHHKKHRKIDINASGGRFWRPNDPQSAPRGSPKGAQIRQKSSKSRL